MSEAINRFIHSIVEPEGCWHDNDVEYYNDGEILRECRICHAHNKPNPDYANDLNVLFPAYLSQCSGLLYINANQTIEDEQRRMLGGIADQSGKFDEFKKLWEAEHDKA